MKQILETSIAEFTGKIVIEEKNPAIDKAKTETANFARWCDGSKWNKSGAGAAVFWKENAINKRWQEWKVFWGENKEIIDVEIWGISEALKVVKKKPQQLSYWLLTYFAIPKQLKSLENVRQ